MVFNFKPGENFRDRKVQGSALKKNGTIRSLLAPPSCVAPFYRSSAIGLFRQEPCSCNTMTAHHEGLAEDSLHIILLHFDNYFSQSKYT
jgi:hypothetical protein